MKNAILVSADFRWRTVTEATLSSRGWCVACSKSLEVMEPLEPSQVQALFLDASSLGAAAVAKWMESGLCPRAIPVIFSPGFEHAKDAGEFLEDSGTEPGGGGAVRIRFWGVRGSIPTPGPETAFFGGNTSCVELKADGETLILDAGSGMRPLGEALIAESGGEALRVHLLVSHTHWDHIQGFPFFRPAYQPGNVIQMLGYSGVRHGLEHVMNMQMAYEYFPISMSDMLADVEVHEVGEEFQCGAVKGHAFLTNHPGKCSGFRFDTSAGGVVYVPDNELNSAGQAAHMPRETAKHLRQRFVSILAGARVLIHDAQYTRAEYQDRVGWGHSCLEDVVELAAEAKVQHLVFFHHDPSRTDAEVASLVELARKMVRENGWDLRVDAAREGYEIVL
jgi:phosphoribosyl 1,2-cyclic phosphodiesterase